MVGLRHFTLGAGPRLILRAGRADRDGVPGALGARWSDGDGLDAAGRGRLHGVDIGAHVEDLVTLRERPGQPIGAGPDGGTGGRLPVDRAAQEVAILRAGDAVQPGSRQGLPLGVEALRVRHAFPGATILRAPQRGTLAHQIFRLGAAVGHEATGAIGHALDTDLRAARDRVEAAQFQPARAGLDRLPGHAVGADPGLPPAAPDVLVLHAFAGAPAHGNDAVGPRGHARRQARDVLCLGQHDGRPGVRIVGGFDVSAGGRRGRRGHPRDRFDGLRRDDATQEEEAAESRHDDAGGDELDSGEHGEPPFRRGGRTTDDPAESDRPAPDHSCLRRVHHGHGVDRFGGSRDLVGHAGQLLFEGAHRFHHMSSCLSR